MKMPDNIWFCTSMTNFYRKNLKSNIISVVFHREAYKYDRGNFSRYLINNRNNELESMLGSFEIDLDFDIMGIDYDYDGFEFELSKDLQRVHDKLCRELYRIPNTEELKLAIESIYYDWGEHLRNQ